MSIFLRKHFHKLIPALILSLAFLFVSGTQLKDSAFSADCELLILWNSSLSEGEASLRLSELCPKLLVSEHFDDLTICKSLTPDCISAQLHILNNDASIRIAEPNQATVLSHSLNDVKYADAQWSLHNTGEFTYYINDIPIHRTSVPDVDINLPEAYDLLGSVPTPRPVTVAVIDTGIDITHPALKNHIFINENEIPNNGLDDDDNGFIDDLFGWDFFNNDNTVCHYSISDLGELNADPDDNDNHGTHCAGIIAASEGIFGVASGIDIRILPLKIHGGTKNTGSVADAVKAIKYAQVMGADICNMSWGTTVYSETLETVMRESDMLFVVAAGNFGNNNNSAPLYPASYSLDNMISVANITQSGELASDSNYGSSTVDIAAPGQDIFSTTVGGNYHYLSGTSMAAPVVSGISALLYACGETPYPQNIKEILLQTLKPMDSLIGYVRYPGIPDAALVVSATDSLVNDTIAPTLRAETAYRETEFLIELHPEDLGGSGIRALRYAMGTLEASYFRNGTSGQSITGSSLALKRAGNYTFYICDYAGNESVFPYTVKDDTVPPTVSASYTENPDGTFTVTVNASDSESGLKRLRYMEGIHPQTFFLSAGQDLSSETDCTFLAEPNSTYTIYAADYRGNKTTYRLDVIQVPAELLVLNVTERTLHPGDSFRLVPLALPLHTTDSLSYAISDETLLYASSDGILTALAPGTVQVTVISSTGLLKDCMILITDPVPGPDSLQGSEQPEDIRLPLTEE